MTDMHEGLLPCPFCGGPAYVSYSDRGEVFSVRCNHWPEVGGSRICMGSGAYSPSEEGAIAAWNRRASAPVPAEPVVLTPEARAAKADVPVETVRWIDRLRHACAASNFHDFDGCDCSAVDLDEAWKRGRLILPQRVPIDSPAIAAPSPEAEPVAFIDPTALADLMAGGFTTTVVAAGYYRFESNGDFVGKTFTPLYLHPTLNRNELIEALSEAAAYILVPDVDLEAGVLSRIRTALNSLRVATTPHSAPNRDELIAALEAEAEAEIARWGSDADPPSVARAAVDAALRALRESMEKQGS